MFQEQDQESDNLTKVLRKLKDEFAEVKSRLKALQEKQTAMFKLLCSQRTDFSSGSIFKLTKKGIIFYHLLINLDQCGLRMKHLILKMLYVSKEEAIVLRSKVKNIIRKPLEDLNQMTQQDVDGCISKLQEEKVHVQSLQRDMEELEAFVHQFWSLLEFIAGTVQAIPGDRFSKHDQTMLQKTKNFIKYIQNLENIKRGKSSTVSTAGE